MVQFNRLYVCPNNLCCLLPGYSLVQLTMFLFLAIPGCYLGLIEVYLRHTLVFNGEVFETRYEW